jgi:hypothetical protein
MNDMLASLTSTRPLGRQLLLWVLLSALITLLFGSALFALDKWCGIKLNLTLGQTIEGLGFLFFFTLTLCARARAKRAALSRQLLNLMKQSLTRNPDPAIEQQFQRLQTAGDLQLGFALLIFRLANGLFKLFFLTLLIHSLLRWIF